MSVEKVDKALYDPVSLLDDITETYSTINEEDLDVIEIYDQRDHQEKESILLIWSRF